MDVCVFNYSDPKIFLQSLLAKLQEKNPKYSYRAWARDLGIKSPSSLSMALTGKRNVSQFLAVKIATRYLVTEKERQFFRAMVAYSNARSPEEKEFYVPILESNHPKRRFSKINAEAFLVLNQWYHFAIIELSKLRNFRLDAAWVSKNLNPKVPIHEVRLALTNLEKMGLLLCGQKKKTRTLRSSNDKVDVNIQKIHAQLIDLAGKAQQQQGIHARDISAHIVATEHSKIPAAKRMIQQFRHDLAEFLESENPDTVYTVNMQLFGLTSSVVDNKFKPEQLLKEKRVN